jgi:hypothetical protein
MITEIVAAIAISAKNTPHAIFLLLEILIFLEFYKCEKYEMYLQRLHKQLIHQTSTKY